jgi:hypothetical protein
MVHPIETGTCAFSTISERETLPSAKRRKRLKLPLWCWIGAGVIAFWGSFTANPILTPVAIAVLVICIELLWRRGEPPVLAFACSMQWLQAAVGIFYTNFYNVSVAQAEGNYAFERATWLSLLAVLALAFGMRAALLYAGRLQGELIRREALRVNVVTAFTLYVATFVIATVAARFAFSVSAIAQVIYALATLKWVATFIFAYAVIEQRRGYILLVVVVLFELAVGMVGFFANFKGVFFILFVVALASPLALRGRRLLTTVGAVVCLFLFGVVWSAIKGEYREFLNQGSGEQEVTVSVEQSAAKFTNLVGSSAWANFGDGLENMVLRIGYTRMFALTLMNVPDNVPFERGALWLSAIEHVFMPRLLFPQKAAVDDSERTQLYTGMLVAGREQGTSIGIGYVAESYVDFGIAGMFVPIFGLGIFFGAIYRVFVIRLRVKLIPAAIASSVLIFGAYTIETSNVKIVGGCVTQLLVLSVLYVFFGRAVQGWLES